MINNFFISEIPLDIEFLKNKLNNPKAGGYVSFEGWIRNHNEGKDVLRLEYEVYEKMSVKEAEKIFKEAAEKFNIVDISCAHRKGLLEIGDIAVYVGVVSIHRGDAFKACEYIINQIKIRLPIWKKEYYKDGITEWVNCQECSKHIIH